MIPLFRDLWANTLFRFLVVGGINTLWGYGVFAVLMFLSVPREVSLLLSTVLGVVFNYFTTGGLVFKSLGGWTTVRFVIMYAGLYFVNLVLLEIMSLISVGNHSSNIQTIVHQLVLMPVMILLTFVIGKVFVFRRDTQQAKAPKQTQR